MALYPHGGSKKLRQPVQSVAMRRLARDGKSPARVKSRNLGKRQTEGRPRLGRFLVHHRAFIERLCRIHRRRVLPQLAVIKVKKQTYQEHINRYGKMREGFLAKKRLVIPAVMALPALFHFAGLIRKWKTKDSPPARRMV